MWSSAVNCCRSSIFHSTSIICTRRVTARRRRVKDRTVLVVDDILDEGVTLAAVKESLKRLGAAEVLLAVFVDKLNGRSKPVSADFVGLTVPDRFVFGFGMDIHGAWRNLPAIYAVREESI